ncbi:MAG: CvpA family protein [Clostridiales bacterium]|nr:CvpA family protein [Clostridiales bacterium]
MNWLDIVILLIVVFAAVRGSVLGLVKSMINLTAIIVSFFAASIYNDALAKWIVENTKILSGIQKFYEFDFFNKLKIPSIQIPEIYSIEFGKVSDYLNKVLSNSDIVKNNIAESFSEYMANATVDILSWLIIFAIGMIIVNILGIVLESVFKLPVLKTLNSLGGFLLGIIKGSLFVFFMVLMFQFIGQMTTGTYLTDLIDGSYFAYYLMKYNILRWIVL